MKITVVDKNTKYPNIFNRVEVKNRECSVCKNRFQYSAKNLADNNCCSVCQFWVDLYMSDYKYGNGVTIDRKHYKLSGSMLSFGGRKVRIEYSDGRVVESELSQEVDVPELFLDTFPDTATMASV